MDAIEFDSILSHFHNQLWGYYLPIPKQVGEPFIDGDNRRIKCTLNDEISVRGALMPNGDIYTLYINNAIHKKLHADEGDVVKIRIEKDHSEYGMQLPESFEVLLDQDEEGHRLFKSLTMGKQRSLIYIVNKVKNIDSQLAKGLAILHHLKEANGKLDFKRLNELIKEYNSRNKRG